MKPFHQNIVKMVFYYELEKINDFDLEKATEIYNEIHQTAYTDDDGNVISCPKCQSINLMTQYPVRKGVGGFFSSLMAFLATMVPVYSKKVFKCKDCGEEFKHV